MDSNSFIYKIWYKDRKFLPILEALHCLIYTKTANKGILSPFKPL